MPAWSIDGKWLFFDARIQGVEQIFKIPKEGGKATQLTSGSGFGPIRASSDGAKVFYTRKTEICSVSTEGHDEQCAPLPVLRPEFCESWTLSPDGLYFIRPERIVRALISSISPAVVWCQSPICRGGQSRGRTAGAITRRTATSLLAARRCRERHHAHHELPLTKRRSSKHHCCTITVMDEAIAPDR